MKKKQFIALISLAMKITVLQIALLGVFACSVYANRTEAQELLNKHVSISVTQNKIVKVIAAVQKETGVKFLYSPSAIQAQRKISCTVNDKKLGDFIEEVLKPLNIGYRIIDDQILLYSIDKKTDTADSQSEFIRKIDHLITGVIRSEKGEPLANVSVIVKGSTTGTTTDEKGVFKLNIPDENTVLVISYVGYQTQEMVINNKTASLDVKLITVSGQLNDVVVVGYGTQRKREVTAAVTSVSAEQFNKGNVPDVAQLLQGKVAGLSISRPGGDPNAGFAIRLRGLSTLGASTSPLVVVDGQVGVDINTIDPNDIQTMDVLKDAASAAIYGTRGSAGVIIITTRRGRGQPVVAYNGSVTVESPTKFTSHMSAAEYKSVGGADYGSNTDWNKEISRTALSHTHNLSVSGSNGGTSYIGSVNYRDNQGIAIKTGFQQLNYRFGITQKALKDKLVFNLDVSNTKRNAQLGWNDAFKYATIFNPTAPVHSTDPGYDITGGGYFEQNFVDYANPVAILEQNTYKAIVKRNNFNGQATYEIIKGLKFSIRYAQENISKYSWVYLPKKSFYVRSFLNLSGYARNGYAWKRDDETFNQLYENTLAYETRIGKLNISAIAGYSYQHFLYNGFNVEAGNFLTDDASEDFNSSLDFKNGKAKADSYKNGSKLVAFFGRLNLNYDDFAFLSASLRREGSSQFGENHKWGMFPAVSAGLDLSKLIDQPDINSLKLRASYGITGALPSGSYYSLQLVGPPLNSPLFYSNGQYGSSYEPTQNANPDLKWERKAEFDLGLDFAFFNNRLTGTFDYYNRRTSDLIFNVNVPVPPYPTSSQYRNIGVMKSNGVELLLAYDVIRQRAFTWNTSVNFSTYHTVLASLNKDLAGSYVGASNLGTPGQEQTQITRAVEGEDIGLLWGPIYRGLNKNGKYVFDDGKGDTTTSTDYKTKVGNGLPKFEFGWTNTFHYQNWDLNFFIRGAIGHDLINTYRAFYENATIVNSYNVVKTKYYNSALNDAQIFSSLFVEKASFVKLDNATLGYNFNLTKSGIIKSIRAFVTGQNLFVITDYSGVDPEVRYDDPSPTPGTPPNILAPGIDRRENWVRTRSFTLGVNLRF